jgi:streptogramin lyase
MESGIVFYVEKTADTVYKIEDGLTTPFVSGLNKPGYLHCDEARGGIWITEDRNNFGRLIFSTGQGSSVVVASGLSLPQSLDFDESGALFLAEQGMNRILRFEQIGDDLTNSEQTSN